MRFIDDYINIFGTYSRVEKSFKVFVPPPYFPSNKQAEMIIGMDRCAEGIQLLRDIINKMNIPVNLITEVRVVVN